MAGCTRCGNHQWIQHMSFLDDLPDLGLPRVQQRQRPETPCVNWTRPRCPMCRSADCPVVDSHAVPVRWHECRNPECPGRTEKGPFRFKSFETNWEGT